MKYCCALLLLVLATYSLSGQCPLENDVYFYSQVEIEAFIADYPDCTQIRGNLTIHHCYNSYDLSGLDKLTSVGGNLEIRSAYRLTSLSGLDNITSIRGDLEVSGNPQLSACATESICRYLEIAGRTATITGNATGCASVEEVKKACLCPQGDVKLRSQAEVDDFLAHYSTCEEFMGSLKISSNVQDISGLSGLVSISGDLTIESCYDLQSLVGLEALTSVEGDLRILTNNNLTSLAGLNELISVENLQIMSNGNLASLMGLPVLASLENLFISGNPKLSVCAIESICTSLAAKKNNANIYSNAPGCDSRTEVEEACKG